MTPTSIPVWLSMDFVVSIHESLISEFGGSAGVRDRGLLESALHRPKNLFHYENERDVFRLAACYAASISANHPFVDGNKRASFLACAVFLEINGFELLAPEPDAAVVFQSLASGELSESELSVWLSDNSERSA